MEEENRQKMIAAMQTIHDLCLEEPCNRRCPFYNNCFRSISPALWEIPEEEEEE